MQFSFKALILTLLVAAPAAQAVTCKEAAIYTGIGAAAATVGKFCFTKARDFKAWGYDQNKSLFDVSNLAAYWHDEVAGHDEAEYKQLGWDASKNAPIFEPAVKGRGWVYYMKKMWKPTATFLLLPLAIAKAYKDILESRKTVTDFVHGPHAHAKKSDSCSSHC